MSSKTEKFSLWLRPFGDIAFKLQQRIDKLSEQYDTPRFEPHVTLVGSLERSKTEMIQLTDMLAGSLSPFELVLTNAGYSDAYYQSLYVHIQKDEALMKARKMAERLFDRQEEDYMPHLSLLYGNLDRNEKERILNVMGREFHFRFGVHNVLLVDTAGKPGSWRKVHSSEFGN